MVDTPFWLKVDGLYYENEYEDTTPPLPQHSVILVTCLSSPFRRYSRFEINIHVI